MTINEESLQEVPCQRLCQDVGIDRPPDGDGLPIHLSESPADHDDLATLRPRRPQPQAASASRGVTEHARVETNDE